VRRYVCRDSGTLRFYQALVCNALNDLRFLEVFPLRLLTM